MERYNLLYLLINLVLLETTVAQNVPRTYYCQPETKHFNCNDTNKVLVIFVAHVWHNESIYDNDVTAECAIPLAVTEEISNTCECRRHCDVTIKEEYRRNSCGGGPLCLLIGYQCYEKEETNCEDMTTKEMKTNEMKATETMTSLASSSMSSSTTSVLSSTVSSSSSVSSSTTSAMSSTVTSSEATSSTQPLEIYFTTMFQTSNRNNVSFQGENNEIGSSNNYSERTIWIAIVILLVFVIIALSVALLLFRCNLISALSREGKQKALNNASSLQADNALVESGNDIEPSAECAYEVVDCSDKVMMDNVLYSKHNFSQTSATSGSKQEVYNELYSNNHSSQPNQ